MLKKNNFKNQVDLREAAMFSGGWFGKYLMVNLSDCSFHIEPLQENLVRDYIGCRGIAAKLLYDMQPGRIDPLSPENNLIIFTGPLNGTNTPGSSRIIFLSKSPLSNTINPSSMGGAFPNAMKRTGWDGVVITGKAQKKLWIHISPDGVSFHDATVFWGCSTSETEKKVKEFLGIPCHVASIGPAGENLVRYAAVVSETRTAARGGIGAVMGSKNLKAIAVSGNRETHIADRHTLREIVKAIRNDQSENPSLIGMQMNGTAGLISVVNAMGGLPTRNFQTGSFEAADDITGSALTEHNRVKGTACQSCPVGCSLISEIKSGKYQGKKVEGPEYETAVMLGSNLGIRDRDIIIAANYLCDEYGLDTISTGNVIGFALECFQRGLLSESSTGGINLRWGDGESALNLISMIGRREGFGAKLAEGVLRLSREIPGSDSFAMQVKGLEIAGYDPRAVFGQALSYAIAPRGGEHGRGGYMIVEFFMPEVDLYSAGGKAERAAWLAENACIYDTVGLCSFNFVPITLVPPLLNAVCGSHYSEETLRTAARRIITLERMFNIREGFSRKDDTLPARILHEPLPDGMAQGKMIHCLDQMLDDYYRLRGWDHNGVPLGYRL